MALRYIDYALVSLALCSQPRKPIGLQSLAPVPGELVSPLLRRARKEGLGKFSNVAVELKLMCAIVAMPRQNSGLTSKNLPWMDHVWNLWIDIFG